MSLGARSELGSDGHLSGGLMKFLILQFGLDLVWYAAVLLDIEKVGMEQELHEWGLGRKGIHWKKSASRKKQALIRVPVG